MCIAIYKKEGLDLPTKRILERCFLKNSDGCGFGWYDADYKVKGNRDAGYWRVKKGFTTFKEFYAAIKEANEEFNLKEKIVVIHFRIGTSGKMLGNRKAHPDCTHPFPISKSAEELMAHDYVAKSIAVHNGVVGAGKGDLSDTMVAIISQVAIMFPYIAKNEDQELFTLLAEDYLMDTKCRWLLAYKNDLWMCGKWVVDDKTGIEYTNDGFKEPPVVQPQQHIRHITQHNQSTGFNPSSPLLMSPSVTHMEGVRLEDLIDVKLKGKNKKKVKFLWTVFDGCVDALAMMKAGNNQKADDIDAKAADAAKRISDAIEAWAVQDTKGKTIAVVDSNGMVEWESPARANQSKINVLFENGIISTQEIPTDINLSKTVRYFRCSKCDSQFDVRGPSKIISCPVCHIELDEQDQIGGKFDTEDSTVHAKTFTCPTCKKTFPLTRMIGGECPGCGTILLVDTPEERAGKEDMHWVACANCGDTKYIIDSTLNIGQYECCRCGEVFNINEEGESEQVFVISDVRERYEDIRRVMLGGSGV